MTMPIRLARAIELFLIIIYVPHFVDGCIDGHKLPLPHQDPLFCTVDVVQLDLNGVAACFLALSLDNRNELQAAILQALLGTKIQAKVIWRFVLALVLRFENLQAVITDIALVDPRAIGLHELCVSPFHIKDALYELLLVLE